jgi:rhodanese-related sulfurtransferase
LKSPFASILAEAAAVVVAGVAIALAANQVSPSGLSLSRNYFPTGTNAASSAPAPVRATPAPITTDTNEPSEEQQISDRLRDKGLQEIRRGEVVKLLHDPGYRAGQIIFVDARDEDHYQDGHIPGAYELNPYHPEKQLGPMLTVCQPAEKVVVYCTGGDCEDSDTAAIILRDAGVPVKKIFVYGGGFGEWSDQHLPVETGDRNSGKISDAK